MESLRVKIQRAINEVTAGDSAVNYSAKAKTYNKSLLQDALSLPLRVKEIVNNGFKQKVSCKADLLSLLERIQEEVQNYAPAVDPTAAELSSLSDACSKLWDLDTNRLVPGTDYEINVQRGKNAYDQGDVAKDPLFKFVTDEALKKPTYKAFGALLDNYVADVGVTEVVTQEELQENYRFLQLIMDTAVMQYIHKYLLLKKKTTKASREDFIKELSLLWFGLYSRKTHNDSSGFEHVFLGEVKDNKEVTGFHNWIRIYHEELAGTFDYFGYIKPKRRSVSMATPSSHEQLVTLQFEYRGVRKNVSTSFIGTSPEFEIALYTLCFYCAEEECLAKIGPYKVAVTCHKWINKSNNQIYIATSFPSEAPLDENEAASKIQTTFKSRSLAKK